MLRYLWASSVNQTKGVVERYAFGGVLGRAMALRLCLDHSIPDVGSQRTYPVYR